jgi:anti-sigma regulatory factor (Ser/Thr protein kinase)
MSVLELVSLVRLPADLRSLVVVRAAVAASLAREGWRGESAARVILAAHEAAANAIEHGSHPSGVVEVEFAIDGERATLRVTDAGRPGAPAPRRIPEASSDPTGERGRGLIIMEAIAERFELHAREDSGTEVRLEFLRAA